jgi:hypothetical protein
LLTKAGVACDLIADMDDINLEFKTCDVSIVIGANDVVNPAAKTDKSSPIYGMPILNVVDSRQTIVIKRFIYLPFRSQSPASQLTEPGGVSNPRRPRSDAQPLAQAERQRHDARPGLAVRGT